MFDFYLQVKRDMVAIKHELDTVQQVKEEIEELREYVDRLEEHTHRRKLRLLEQVSSNGFCCNPLQPVYLLPLLPINGRSFISLTNYDLLM